MKTDILGLHFICEGRVKLVKQDASGLGRAHDTMHCLTVCTVKQRVAKHLLSLRGDSSTASHRQGFMLEDSRTELAEFLGTTLEAISRTFAFSHGFGSGPHGFVEG